MKNSINLLQELNSKLDPMTIDIISRTTDVITRERKVTAINFIKAFCLITFYNVCSLRIIATTLGTIANVTISKQALSKRITPEFVNFFREVLFSLITKLSTFKKEAEKGVFSVFNRVLLQDSTNISLPKRLAKFYPGSQNQSKKPTATLKMQATYDAKSENFVTFLLSPFTRND